MNEKRPPPYESKKSALYFDVKRYDALLNEPNVSQEEREEVLNTLWNLVQTCVDFGWGVHPLPTNCGQADISPLLSSEAAQNVVNSKSSELAKTFTSASDARPSLDTPPMRKGA